MPNAQVHLQALQQCQNHNQRSAISGNNDAIRQYYHRVLLWTKVASFVNASSRVCPTANMTCQRRFRQSTSNELDLWAYANGHGIVRLHETRDCSESTKASLSEDSSLAKRGFLADILAWPRRATTIICSRPAERSQKFREYSMRAFASTSRRRRC